MGLRKLIRNRIPGRGVAPEASAETLLLKQDCRNDQIIADLIAVNFDERAVIKKIDAQFGGVGEAMIERVADAMLSVKASGPLHNIPRAQILRRLIDALKCRRKLAVLATARLSGLDDDFRAAVADADAKRDARDWSAAQAAYFYALQAYPFSAGYYVQYAHCLKERSKWEEAELYYRTAWSLGEASDDLLEHLMFVTHRREHPADKKTLEAIRCYWSDARAGFSLLEAPPTERDVQILFRGLLGEGTYWFIDLCALMNQAPTIAIAVEKLVRMPQFSKANRDLLTVILEDEGTAA